MNAQLRFNICDITSSFRFDEEHLSEDVVGRFISPALVYSSRHWADHLPAHEPQWLNVDLSQISSFSSNPRSFLNRSNEFS